MWLGLASNLGRPRTRVPESHQLKEGVTVLGSGEEGFRSAIARAKGGSPDDFGRLVSDCRDYLLLVAHQMLDSSMVPKEGVSDVVQDTFVEAQRGIASFRGETEEEFRGWLRKILIRLIFDMRRRYRSTQKRSIEREVSLDTATDIDTREFAIESKDPSPSSHAQHEEQLQLLKAALRKIPENQARVVILHHRDGLSMAEIADRLGKTEAAVRKLWTRGIKALQEEVAEHQS
jgi:RNA polymerase sigma-70 factor (ECF subfamily)